MIQAAEIAATRDMNRIYRYQRHIYDLTRRCFLLGRDRLLDELAPPKGGSVLEVGCGTGRNLIQAARRYPDATFYGFDVSDQMLATAASAITRRGLTSRIRLAQADAATFDAERTFGQPGFDRVFISYALSMIPPRREAMTRAIENMAAGGSLHIVDFGRQDDLPVWFRTVLFAWLRQFSVHPIDTLRTDLHALAERYGATFRFAPLYRGYASYAVIEKS